MSLPAPFFWALAYLLGSLPFGLWVTRLVKNVDIRDGGSGHVTTTNTIRQAGWMPGLAVFLLDLGKGFLPVFFASRAGQADVSIGITSALAVIGHCWPVFAQFRGGMGLATMGGALLAVSPFVFLIALGTLILLVLIFRHGARAGLFAGIVIPIALYLTGFRHTEIWIAAMCGLVIALRFTIDWNRKYRELWLDREKKPG